MSAPRQKNALSQTKNRDIPGFFSPEKRLLLCGRAAATDDLRNGNCRVQQVIIAAIIFGILNVTGAGGQSR
jgi:hypothetical protein